MKLWYAIRAALYFCCSTPKIFEQIKNYKIKSGQIRLSFTHLKAKTLSTSGGYGHWPDARSALGLRWGQNPKTPFLTLASSSPWAPSLLPVNLRHSVVSYVWKTPTSLVIVIWFNLQENRTSKFYISKIAWNAHIGDCETIYAESKNLNFLTRLILRWIVARSHVTENIIFHPDVASLRVNPLKPNSSNYYTLPYRPNLPFLISDIRALWRSGVSARVPECQK